MAMQLFADFHNKKNKINEKTAILNFLIQSGHGQEAFNLLREWPNKEKYFPWSVFFELLLRKDIVISDEEYTTLTDFIKIQGFDLQVSKNFTSLNSKFKSMIQDTTQQLQYTSQQQLKLLWDKLEFIKDRDLTEQQDNIFKQLMLYDSSNPQLNQLLEDFNKKKAMNMLNRQSKDTYQIDYANYADNSLNEEENKFCQNLYQHITETTYDNDKKYYLYTILFYQMEAYEFALNCIKKATQSLQTQWLEIELLHLNKRYFECIDACNKIFMENLDNADIQMACLYQKSQSMWEVGSQQEAIEVMSSLLKIRPYFRSAYEILQSWMAEY